jgi:carbonic anhydrase
MIMRRIVFGVREFDAEGIWFLLALMTDVPVGWRSIFKLPRTGDYMKLIVNRIPGLVVSSLLTIFLAGCAQGGGAEPVATTRSSSTIDKAEQSTITPDAALARLEEGNRRFVSGESLRRDYPAQVKATASGQYPMAVVLSCIDSRSGPEIVFDQGIGDLFVARVAGNYVQADILGSMEFATKVAGAKLIVVMGHTECGAIKGACDNVELGNLTTVIQALRPAVDDVKDIQDDRTSKNKKFVQLVAEANVRRTVAKIREDSPILRELEQSGQIKIVGAMNDLSTGLVTFYDWDKSGEKVAQ